MLFSSIAGHMPKIRKSGSRKGRILPSNGTYRLQYILFFKCYMRRYGPIHVNSQWCVKILEGYCVMLVTFRNSNSISHFYRKCTYATTWSCHSGRSRRHDSIIHLASNAFDVNATILINNKEENIALFD